MLAAAVSGVVFFLVWGILIEGGEEAPWVTAGIASSLMMIAAVVVREVVLRRARRQYLEAEKRLDRNLKKIPAGRGATRKKLSIEEHRLMLRHIGMKSDAARVLHDVGEGHHEVFLLCDDYLRLTKEELGRTDVNSPRFVAMRKGRQRVKKLHKFHLLAWSEIESRSLSLEARNAPSVRSKLGKASRALEIVEEASQYYPLEEKLVDSAAALRELVSSLNVSRMIEKAEEQEASGKHLKALETYEALLAALPDSDIEDSRREHLLESVEKRLAELRSTGGRGSDR